MDRILRGLLIPQTLARGTVHGLGDRGELVEELGSDAVVPRGIFLAELHRHGQHLESEKGHPARSIRLFEVTAGGRAPAPIEGADVVEAQETPVEEPAPGHFLEALPPAKVPNQGLEDRGEKVERLGPIRAGQLEDPQAGPGMHRRIDVAEREFIGRHLTGGMQVALAEEELQLSARETGVHPGERDHVKGQVPGRVPGVLPGVGDGDDVAIDDMSPIPVASVTSLRRGRRLGGVASDPVRHVEVVELLGPQKRRITLAKHILLVRGRACGQGRFIEPIGFLRAHSDRLFRVSQSQARLHVGLGGEPQMDHHRLPRFEAQPIVRPRLRSLVFGIDRVQAAADHELVKSILDERLWIRGAEDTFHVGFVLGKEDLRFDSGGGNAGLPEVWAQFLVGQGHAPLGSEPHVRPGAVSGLMVPPPDPGVPKPELRDEVKESVLAGAVGQGELHDHVGGRRLCVLGGDIDIPIAIEDAGVLDLELGIGNPAFPALTNQPLVRVCPERVFVEGFQIRMGGRRVQVVVELLDVLVMVSFGSSQTEEALLQDRIAAVPQGQTEAQPRFAIAEAEKSVLPPAIDPRSRVVVGEIVPAGSIRGVVLADGAPLALGQIGAEEPPVLIMTGAPKTIVLGGGGVPQGPRF